MPSYNHKNIHYNDKMIVLSLRQELLYLEMLSLDESESQVFLM